MSLSVIFPHGDRPLVLVTPEAWADMFYITDNTKTEVGWMATVEQLTPFRFRILEVFLLEQEAHATTTELLGEAVAKLVDKLFSEDRLEDVQRLNSWHHSHVQMGLSASSDDNNTLAWFMSKVDNVPFVAIRTNQKGAVTADIGYPNGMVLSDVEVREDLHVRDEAHLAGKWDDAIKTLVKPFAKPVYNYTKGGQHGYYAGYGKGGSYHQQRSGYQPSGHNEWPDWPAKKKSSGETAADRLHRQDEAVANWKLTPLKEVTGKAAKRRWFKMAGDLIAAEDTFAETMRLAGDDEAAKIAAEKVYVNMVDEVIYYNEEFWNEGEVE